MVMSYVGAQADKLPEAIEEMNELHRTLPRAAGNLTAAREAILNQYRTERILRSDILFDYLEARRFGREEDARRIVYDQVDDLSFEELAAFHAERYSGRPYAICVIGSKESVDLERLAEYGRVVELSIDQVLNGE